jgi:hypothetical protein
MSLSLVRKSENNKKSESEEKLFFLCGLFRKHFTIVIYNCHDIELYYKTSFWNIPYNRNLQF